MTRRDIFKLFAGVTAIPAVKAVETLEVGPRDIVVIKFEQRLSDNQKLNVKETWNSRFKHIPAVILDGGADIQVLRNAR